MSEITNAGFLMVAGMDPVYDPITKKIEFGWHADRGVLMDANTGVARTLPNKLQAADMFLPGAGGLFMGAGVVGALYSGGITEASQFFAGEVATSSAIYKHHFLPAAASGNVSGKVLAPGLITGIGSKDIGKLARLANTGKYLGFSASGFLGASIGGAIGEATGGFVGSIFGEYGRKMGRFSGGITGATTGAFATAGAMSALMTPVGAGLAVGVGSVGLAMAVGVGAATAVGYGTYQTLKAGYGYQQMRRSINTSGSLAAFNTHDGQTMRARAVQAIHKNHMNTRSALGQEANYMHLPSRSYNSKYRGNY